MIILLCKAAYTRRNRLYNRLYNRLHRVYGVLQCTRLSDGQTDRHADRYRQQELASTIVRFALKRSKNVQVTMKTIGDK